MESENLPPSKLPSFKDRLSPLFERLKPLSFLIIPRTFLVIVALILIGVGLEDIVYVVKSLFEWGFEGYLVDWKLLAIDCIAISFGVFIIAGKRNPAIKKPILYFITVLLMLLGISELLYVARLIVAGVSFPMIAPHLVRLVIYFVLAYGFFIVPHQGIYKDKIKEIIQAKSPMVIAFLLRIKNKLWLYLQTKWQEFKSKSTKDKLLSLKIPAAGIAVVLILRAVYPYFLPPKVVTSIPAAEAEEVPIDSVITLEFDRDMNKTAAEHAFSVTPAVEGALSWENNRMLVFTPSKPLARGTTYAVTVLSSASSTLMIPAFKPYTTSFTTFGHPKISLASPEYTTPEKNTPITVIFDRAMIPLTTATNSAAKQPAFTIVPETEGEGRWLGTTVYQFRPAKPYRKATTFSYTVKKGLQSEDGGVLQEDATFSFSSERPYVLQNSNEMNASYASPVASVAAIFNFPVDPKSASEKAHLYHLSGGGKEEVPVTVRVSGTHLGMYPVEPLHRKETYHAVIEKGILSTLGENGMDDEYAWSFSVAPQPGVILTTPSNGQKNVENEHSITVQFASPMDDKSFKGNVSLSPQPEGKLNVFFNQYSRELNITTYLARSTDYTVTINGSVRDIHGVPLGTYYQFSFTTAELMPSISIVPSGTYFATFNQNIVPRIVAKVGNATKVDYALYKLTKEEFMSLYQRRYSYSSNDYKTQNWQNYNPSKLELVRQWSETYEAEPNIPVNVITKVEDQNGQKLSSGLYFLDASIGNGVHDNMVMIVTRSTLTLKVTESQALVWAVDHTSGEPIDGMNIEILNGENVSKDTGQTNTDGVYLTEKPIKSKHASGLDNHLFVFGTKGDDVTVLSNGWNEGISTYDFSFARYYDPNERDDYHAQSALKIHLMLDRPIYRPGQKVYYKGVVRSDNDGLYSLVANPKPVTVTVKDAQGKSVFTANHDLTSYGSFSGEFDLSSAGSVGYYNIQAGVEGNRYEQSFQVEEYRKPEFEVEVSTDRESYTDGDSAVVSVDAKYYFGASLTNVPVRWTVSTQDYSFSWSKDSRFEFGDADNYWYRPWWGYYSSGSFYGKKIAEGTGRLDSHGHYEVKLPQNIADKTTGQRLRIEAVVEDANSYAIANSKEFTVAKSAINIGLKPQTYYGQTNSEATVDLVSVDTNGNELSQIPVHVVFYKRTWDYVREQSEDDGLFYWVSKHTDTEVAAADVTTDDYGRAVAGFTPAEGGSYRAVATAVDSGGNRSTSATYLWVSGYGSSARMENHDRINLIPDKQEYSIGDTAGIYAAVPYEAMTGLVTLERGSVMDYKIIRTTAENQSFQVGMKDTYSPNIYVSTMFVKPGNEVKDPPQMKMGIAELRVNNPKQRLSITTNTDKDHYGPGQKLTGSIEVKDMTQTPVKAEVAVALVDKAVWSLARAELADIFETFYRPRNLAVSTSNNLTISMDRVNANTNLGSKGGSGGGCFSGGTLVDMADGTKKSIASVAVGDVILTRASETGPDKVAAKVTKVFVHDVTESLVINHTLHTTPVHRFYTKDGWKTGSDLTTNDFLLTAEGKWQKVNNVTLTFDPVRVYNLEVETFHTYIAGGFYVHNDKGGPDTARDTFLDNAYWNAHLETNDQGQASFSVDLPDNLTTWKVIAVALTKDTAVGDSESDVLVTKDVLIEPLLPRFLSVGDEPELGMTVHNTTSLNQTITAGIKATGVSVSEPTQQTVTIPPYSLKTVTFQSKVEPSEEATVEMEVVGSEQFTDKIRKTLPVVTYYTAETVATSGEAADTATQTIRLPDTIVENQGQLTFTLSPSLGMGIAESTSYSFNYPYYCAEQTVSRLTPAVYFLRMAKEMKADRIGGYSTDSLKKIISDAVQRLVKMQQADGGWGWWDTYKSDPFISALVMDGLLSAKEDGYPVDSSVIQRGTNYLNGLLSGNQLSLDNQAYIASIISRNQGVNQAVFSNLMEKRWTLTLLGRTYLLHGLQSLGDSRDAAKLRDELESLAKISGTTAHWEDKKHPWYMMSNDTTVTALLLEALVKDNPKNPLVTPAIKWLMDARRDQHWHNTRDTSATIRAVTTALVERHEGGADYQWKLWVNNKQIAENTFGKDDFFKSVQESVLPSVFPRNQDIPVKIEKIGTGNLYYDMNLKYYLPFEKVEPLDQGIVVLREFVDTDGQALDNTKVTTGDDVWVRLTLALPTRVHHVIIEDKLAAGLEPVNNSLATTATLNAETVTPSKEGRSLYFSRQEMRDDRVVLFAETVPAGVYEYTYRVRPTTPGRYHYSPASAYNMYIPDISGHSSGDWLEVVKE